MTENQHPGPERPGDIESAEDLSTEDLSTDEPSTEDESIQHTRETGEVTPGGVLPEGNPDLQSPV